MSRTKLPRGTLSEAAILVIAGVIPPSFTIGVAGDSMWTGNNGHRRTEPKVCRPAGQVRCRIEKTVDAVADPSVLRWSDRNHGKVEYYLIHLFSGHGYSRNYLHKMGSEKCPDCPRMYCPNATITQSILDRLCLQIGVH